ncbi:MAG: glycosyltransferase [Lachnospiraceae bacterium]|nr:glycosyltransferase [Lachnospiraceae bacterium]
MKILFLKWECFGIPDILAAFEKAGHEVAILETSQEGLLDPAIADKVSRAMKENGCNAVFGFNYFPHVAKAAAKDGFEYYSWVYDNPCVQLYSCTVPNPTNHIFVFDSDTCLKFNRGGIGNVYYLPMAADPDRIEKVCADARAKNAAAAGSARAAAGEDITFVGLMYSEKHNFYDRMISKGVSAHTEGYLRGIMEAQKLLYGMNITEAALTDEILEDMHRALPLEPDPESVITRKTLFNEYVINRQITAEERSSALTMLGTLFGEDHKVGLYTGDGSLKIAGIVNHGPVDPERAAYAVYNGSRINLNISLRSIVNGIPLRCFDIMGAGGFLLTSYAGDMTQFFTDGEHYISFDSMEDMLTKCAYYLEHEDERSGIAAAGLAAIKENHTYYHRVLEMFD